jgi:hypothetical protein
MKQRAKMKGAAWKRGARGLAAFAVLVCLAAPMRAQTTSGTFTVVCVARNPIGSDELKDPEKVITHKHACLDAPVRLHFGDRVTLAVEHAANVTFDDTGEPNPADLVLFLDGKPLPGTRAAVGASATDEDDVTTTLLTYHITRDLTTQEARKNWKDLVLAARSGRTLTISTGLEKGPAAQSHAVVEFTIFGDRAGRLVGWFLAAAAGAFVFFSIAAGTGVLRDKEPGEGLEVTERAYSLSRTQAAFWTVLVIYAFLFIWFVTGEYNATIPASVVGLMGITLATFGTAAALDATNVQNNKAKVADLKEKLAQNPPEPVKTTLEKEKKQIEPRTTVCKSEGFWRDIISNADGAGLHRLQFMVWTLALAVVFVVNVWQTLAMPDFDATLLGLMGITSGTYAILKAPEKKR